MDLPMLVADRLVRRFGDRLAVDAVGFEVRPGEVFGLLGPNGAGKTTTLRMLGGLIAPTGGEVRVEGVALTRATGPALRRRIGFLTETPGLWEALSVTANLSIYGRLFGVRDLDAAITRTLQRFDLWDRRAEPAAVLSKGMKQKLALGRTLLHDPAMVLLDEPTANLDPKTARDVRDLLLDLKSRGRAVVVSTHNLDEIERIADRIALISTRLIAIGEPAELRRRIFGRRLRIRLAAEPGNALVSLVEQLGAVRVAVDETVMLMEVDDPDERTPALVRALVEAGAAIREVTEESPSLEDVYLQLLGADADGIGWTEAAGARR
jgi:ABC-2 type transport system ATP-binding protein